MAYYGLSDEQVLRMPVRRFWLLEKNVDRLQAERDLRNIAVVSSPHVKGANEIHQKLVEELGTIIIANAERDENATERLMALSRLTKG